MLEARLITKTFSLKKPSRKGAQGDDPRRSGRKLFALKEVSFKALPNQVFGLLGANGAGKTTLLRIISTALRLTSGSVLFQGANIDEDPIGARKRIGFLSGNTGLYGRLTPRETLVFFGRLYSMTAREIEGRVKRLGSLLSMTSFLDQRNATLSSGMRQKVSIARTLLHDPDILLFDELTTGLDVGSAESVLSVVQLLRDQGKTILFSTHHMEEVERVCQQVVIIDGGRICFEGTVEDMLRRTGESYLDKAFLQLINYSESTDET